MPYRQPSKIEANVNLRIPQREGWKAIRSHYAQPGAERETSLVLPVGCGKSGLIALTPFAVQARRVLVIAPGKRIRDQLTADLKANSQSYFYDRFQVLEDHQQHPEACVIASNKINKDTLQQAHIVVANIQQISGEENRWLDDLADDFFDLILVDEAHHNIAQSWQQVKGRFPEARIINFSATPHRSDGNVMEGQVIYSFPVLEAIKAGYVKRLQAKMLDPTRLRYIDKSSGQEREIGPEEVRQLGETDAAFRRGIVMSDDTLSSIVDHALEQLLRLRKEASENNLKIIASALNQAHCIQIVAKFRDKGYRADYVHSNLDSKTNDRIFKKLEDNELDVIVQARMLGEGFDHPLLAVAMVGSIFANLSPFIQFVGRIMRAITQNQPGHPTNQGVVVFHAGANVASRWADFRDFSEADQSYFSELLPEAESVPFDADGTSTRMPGTRTSSSTDEMLEQINLRSQDLQPIGDPELAEIYRKLAERGITPEEAAQGIRRFRPNYQDQTNSGRFRLDAEVKTTAGALLKRLALPHGGRKLDPRKQKTNSAWLISRLHLEVNKAIGKPNGDRQSFTLAELRQASELLPQIAQQLEASLRA